LEGTRGRRSFLVYTKQANKRFAATQPTRASLWLHFMLLWAACLQRQGETGHSGRYKLRCVFSKSSLVISRLLGRDQIASASLLQAFRKPGFSCTKQLLACNGGNTFHSVSKNKLYLSAWYSVFICLL